MAQAIISAREFGGTFAMRHGYTRYTGSFGARRTDVGNIFTDDTALSLDIGTYVSLQAISDDADADTDDENDDKSTTLTGTAVQGSQEKLYNRPTTHTVDIDDDDDDDTNNETMVVDSPPSWSEGDHLVRHDFYVKNIYNPFITLTFNDDGEISGTSLHIGNNVGDNAYIATLDDTATGSATSFIKRSTTDFPNAFNDINNDNSTIEINRNFNNNNNNAVTFSAQYMMNIYWSVTDRLHPTNDDGTDLNVDRHGYVVAGFETIGDKIPTEGNVEFSGYGSGCYHGSGSNSGRGCYYNTSSNNINFNVTADIDFSTRTIEFETTSIYYSDAFLDFNTILSYETGQNNISGVVEVDGMKGTIDAHFYGRGNDASEELGGTFAMRDGAQGVTEYYYGYFGAFREHHDVDYSFDGVSSIAVNGTDRVTAFSSLAVSASLDVAIDKAGTMNAWLDDASLADLTLTSETTPTLETVTTTSPQMNIVYRGENIHTASVRFNDGSSTQTYTLEDTITATPSTPTLLTGMFEEDDRFVTGTMEVSRGSNSSQIFGFGSKYMIAARWNLISNSGTAMGVTTNTVFADADTSASITQRNGFMIAGFENRWQSRQQRVKFCGNRDANSRHNGNIHRQGCGYLH